MNKKLSKIVLSRMLGATAATSTAFVATSCAKREVAEVLYVWKANDTANKDALLSKEFTAGVTFSLITNDGKATPVEIMGHDINLTKESYLKVDPITNGTLTLKPDVTKTSQTDKPLQFHLKYKLTPGGPEKSVYTILNVRKWFVVSVAEITANDPTNTDKKINKTFTKGLTIQLKSSNGIYILITSVTPATKPYLMPYTVTNGKLTIAPKTDAPNSDANPFTLTLTYKDETGANQTFDTPSIIVESWT